MGVIWGPFLCFLDVFGAPNWAEIALGVSGGVSGGTRGALGASLGGFRGFPGGSQGPFWAHVGDFGIPKWGANVHKNCY